MLNAKTVLILGAGASVEVGLPTGPELLSNIVDMIDFADDKGITDKGDQQILRALEVVAKRSADSSETLTEYVHLGATLSRSAAQAISIDNLIDSSRNDRRVELIGKLAIVRRIWEAERGASLFSPVGDNPDRLKFSDFNETWYDGLTKLLTERLTVTNLDEVFNNLKIINFNYDRCLEHYLPISLANYYAAEVSQVRGIMPRLKMFRPYGSVGVLPWQTELGNGIPFGGAGYQKLETVSRQIRTFTERRIQGEEIEAIRDAIGDADRIVFLGFAFHQQNIDLLQRIMKPDAEVLGTTLGMSDANRKIVEKKLRVAFRPVDHRGYREGLIELPAISCKQFFSDYSHWLTSPAGISRVA